MFEQFWRQGKRNREIKNWGHVINKQTKKKKTKTEK